ncbi:MAG: helix-turn-helix transcriptional regulator [Victivallaceae bacterium]
MKRHYHFITIVEQGAYSFYPPEDGRNQDWLYENSVIYGFDGAQSRGGLIRSPLRTITLGIYQTGFLGLVEHCWNDGEKRSESIRSRPGAMLPYKCLPILDLLDRTARTGEFRPQAEYLLRYLLECCLELIEHAGARDPGGKPERLWGEIAAWLNGNLDGDLGNLATARQFRISSSYLNTLCRRQTGMSFTLFVRHLRITRAAELLQDGVPVKQLIESCGYRSASYFTRHFKSLTGVPPGKYPGCAASPE